MNILSSLKRTRHKLFPHKRIQKAREEHNRLKAMDTRIPDNLLMEARVLSDREALLNQMPKGGHVAEVGVSLGVFAERIVEVCDPEKLYLIDAWAMALEQFGEPALKTVEAKFAERISDKRVELKRGWSWDMVATLEDASLDWAYIDASHEFDAVSKDLETMASKIKPGGYICGHDYQKFSRNIQRYGVVEAVHLFVINQGWSLAFLTIDADTPGSFAVRKPG